MVDEYIDIIEISIITNIYNIIFTCDTIILKIRVEESDLVCFLIGDTVGVRLGL